MAAPAERLEVPNGTDMTTYANSDLTHVIDVFGRYGVHLLTTEEIHATMPEYPASRRMEIP